MLFPRWFPVLGKTWILVPSRRLGDGVLKEVVSYGAHREEREVAPSVNSKLWS